MPTLLDNLSDETRDELASLALKLSGNQKTRKGFLGLVKEASPDTPIAEVDIPAQIEQALKTERDATAKMRQDWEQEKFAAELGKKKSGVMQKYGLDEAGMKAIEERMTKKELPADYEFAARLYKNELDQAPPTNYGTSGYGPFNLKSNAEGMKGLMENEQAWSLTEAHNIIDDLQKRGAKAAF